MASTFGQSCSGIDKSLEEILEEKWLTVFPLKLERWIFISRSPLDFQDFERKNSLSPLVSQDFILKFTFSSRFSRFLRWNIDIESLFLFSIFKIIFFFLLSIY